MTLKILSLNIERDKHLPKVFNLLKKEKPEVVCLQEVQEPDFEVLKEKFGLEGFFVPMDSFLRNENGKPELVRQGIAYCSNLPILKMESLFYVGKGTAPTHNSGNDVDRVLVLGQVEKEGEKYTIATTHFTWADDGGVNEEQRRDLKQLLKLLRQKGELVLCGDFNAPRGREIFTILSSYLKDNIPPEVQTTLDPKLHRAGTLPYVVDYMWSTPSYKVTKVKVVSGVSDHMAIVAEIKQLYNYKPWLKLSSKDL